MVDNALSPKVAQSLRELGHDAAHVRDYGLQASDDLAIFQRAANEVRILKSADTDFAAILASTQATLPSLILFRGAPAHSPEAQTTLLQANLPQLEKMLASGSIVVFEADRIRIRSLPIEE